MLTSFSLFFMMREKYKQINNGLHNCVYVTAKHCLEMHVTFAKAESIFVPPVKDYKQKVNNNNNVNIFSSSILYHVGLRLMQKVANLLVKYI